MDRAVGVICTRQKCMTQLLYGCAQAALRGMRPGDILHLYSTADAPPTLDATAHMRSALRCAPAPS